jgi:type I restriction-modification system DNA methylase subunit
MLEKTSKSLESWIWDAACSIRGAKDAPKYKEFILPLIFAKRLCDVFDDELNRIAQEVGSRAKAFRLVKHDKKLVRFYLPLEPKNPDDAVWSVIRTLSDKIGEQLTTHLRAIAEVSLQNRLNNSAIEPIPAPTFGCLGCAGVRDEETKLLSVSHDGCFC